MKKLIQKVKKVTEKIPRVRIPEKAVRLKEKTALLWMLPLSFLLVFVIEWMARHSFSETISFCRLHTTAFCYNVLVVYVIYSLSFLAKRRSFVRSLITVVLLILGAINGVVLLSRVSPFGYTDISMIGDLLSMKNSKYVSAGESVLIITGMTVVIVYLIVLFIKGRKTEAKVHILFRFAFCAALFAGLPFLTKTLQYKGHLNAYFGNLAQGYSDNGFLYGFGSSVFGLGMKKPIWYCEDEVKKVREETKTGETKPVNGKNVNIVVVLLESYLDPTEVKYLEMDGDPVPYFHKLESEYSSGHLRVPVVGAGTCDTEFEMLTGMSLQFFGPGEYPQKTVLKKVDGCESLASDLNSLGYSCHVVHNNGANFYSRKNSFSKMGFNTFTSKEMLDITEYNPIRSWPTDDILIDATKDAMDSTSDADFVYTITVATHGNYPEKKVFSDPEVQVTAAGKDAALNNKWEYYVNMLHREDEWIRNYIDMLDQRGEPTLVIMFGDHIPTMGLTNEDLTTNDIFQTKYITWNNFGMEKKDMDLTSYNVVSEFYDRLGIHGGTIMDYNQSMIRKGIPAGSFEYMKGLETLQYDLLYGEKYVYDGKDPYPATGIQMGIHDVTLDRVYRFGGSGHVFGDHFSKWSKVYINGKQVDTEYQSGQHLTFDSEKLESGDTVVVNQMGSGNDILRSSNQRTYTAPEREESEEED
uniref:LTA synthase family protein n=1 Tax=Eubacterium cellulosolvens TaxID=29322 RepID=UPI0004827C27|nr:LTA synthase family protein [[Eubacterium] cellulosolvens]